MEGGGGRTTEKGGVKEGEESGRIINPLPISTFGSTQPMACGLIGHA